MVDEKASHSDAERAARSQCFVRHGSIFLSMM
jgi:hypothetical protein